LKLEQMWANLLWSSAKQFLPKVTVLQITNNGPWKDTGLTNPPTYELVNVKSEIRAVCTETTIKHYLEYMY
jgi:hypothetical protein